jgi:hypothetical protein
VVPGDVVGARESENDEQEFRPFFQLRVSIYRYISIRLYIGLAGLFLAYILSVDGRKSIDQVRDRLVVVQPVAKVPQHSGRVRAAAPVGEPVIDPEPILFRHNQPGVLKQFQVLGDGRLRDIESSFHLADAQNSLLKHFDDFDPIRVGKSLHHLKKGLHT